MTGLARAIAEAHKNNEKAVAKSIAAPTDRAGIGRARSRSAVRGFL